MNQAYTKILPILNKEQKILTGDSVWLKAFANVDLDKVHPIELLPCFKEKEGKIENYLESFDLILVSNPLAKTESTQWVSSAYKRYKLHLEPFLEKALKRNWAVEEVEHYGKIYRKMLVQ